MLQVAPDRVPGGTRAHRRLEIRGLTPDVRRVSPGTVFVALPDRNLADPYAAYAAADRGAEAVICEPNAILPTGIARIEVPDSRRAFVQAASAFFGHPERALEFFGVPSDRRRIRGARLPSTNTAHLLAGLLTRDGRSVGCFTELSCAAAGRQIQCPLSELDMFELFEWLAHAVRAGERQIVFELTPVLEAALGPEFQFRTSAEIPPSEAAFQGTWKGSVVSLGGFTVSTRLVGRQNWAALERAVKTAASVAPMNQVAGRVPRLSGTTGFLEPVRAGQPFGVFVDGARTTAELTDLLTDVGTFHGGRVVLVLGGPAAMDAAGRRELGAATERANGVIVTADDSEYRPVEELANEVVAGAGAHRCLVEPNRERAIFRAISQARTGDIILVTGKAHRNSETFEGALMPCDDRRILHAALANRGYGGTRI